MLTEIGILTIKTTAALNTKTIKNGKKRLLKRRRLKII